MNATAPAAVAAAEGARALLVKALETPSSDGFDAPLLMAWDNVFHCW
jgi:hypothetical protein